ncbi:hypothetical protein [Allorhodopirellula heiligendammensis]|uniref:BlaR1 peptidase M56 n=1 Tax=Allorhodopirellula heiligendammensis TaxID=2714739 RepID=A0A5C6BVU8_9BACT|nr:hypothetical protein [Allorhodopirellula heiligendammensis]TWU16410.1 hypothetical protein Poly21_36150 [Allorhodopirellula heiligendammensis]|tara:strand:+ start:46 stop:444 length:399 start_codon:yes stop_codon:yes gene_type:complete
MSRTVVRIIGYLWAGPNTVLGIAIGLLLGGRFKCVDGVLEIHGRHVSRALARLIIPASALTMGHVVFGRDPESLAVTRLHERVHVRQYEIWGPFFLPAYLGISLWLYARRRDGYRENPFEIEAYAVEEQDGH